MNGGEVFEFCLWLKMHFYFILGMFLNVVFRCTYKMYVFQVSNTPWIEMHSYVLSHTSAGVMSEVCEEEGRLSFHFQKSFHVSPFMDMDHKYNFAFTDLGENAICDITMCKGADLYFDSKVSQSRSLTHRCLHPCTQNSLPFINHRSFSVTTESVPIYTTVIM